MTAFEAVEEKDNVTFARKISRHALTRLEPAGLFVKRPEQPCNQDRGPRSAVCGR